MKSKFVLVLAGIFTITALLLTGCTNGSQRVGSRGQQSSVSTAPGSSAINKDAKNITDSDLISSAKQDEDVQLDSPEDQSQQLSSDDIDSLLNDNGLDSIPSNFSAK
ncbi:MAG: hypothetical protein Q8930_11465 [Bacillota bacterium]|nr:hypothetical protein [Bacillota bacterium]